MKNINELIGIVKGINFDDVVNEKEVEHLQAWVDQNRNLAYEPQQAFLLELLDKVLEDNVITDDEREILLSTCLGFEKTGSYELSSIDELNGIIEGIICDGKVNEEEIRSLRNWMEDNKNILVIDKNSNGLLSLIDEILEDDIVTEQEQEKILFFLNERLEDIKLNVKLDQLRKDVKERKNIGLSLIDLLDDGKALDKIHKAAEFQLIYMFNRRSKAAQIDREIIFISLVLIGMLHYDGNYYDYVRETYKDAYDRFSEQSIEGRIRSVLNQYQSINRKQSNRNRLINVVLENALVPSYFLRSFFDFIYDIYRINFNYELSDSLYDDFKFVYEGLQNYMGKESDELNLSITKKTYRLIRTTQNLILDKKEMDEIIHFSILILNIIDKTLTNGPQEIHNLYLKKGYSEWLKKTDINWKSKRSKGSGMRTRWEPKFIAYDEQVFLVPPNHRIHNHYDYDQIKIEVYNGTEKIYQNSNPTMKEIVGGYEIEQKRINLSAPLGKIRYRVKAGEEDVIYDSGDALFRHFIVFDLKGNEIKNNHDYSGTVAVCQKDTGEVQPYFKADQYCFTSRSVQVGSIIKIAGEAFNFSALIKPGVVGEEIEKSALISESGRKVKIFKDMKYVIFESEKNENDLFYELDGQIVPISEKKFSKSKNNLVYRYVIVMGKIDSGMHRVRILRRDGNRKKTVFSELFVVDHQLLYEARMIGGNRIFISVQSDLFDYLIEKEIEIHEFREDLIAVKIQTELYYLRLPFDLPIYQLDDNEWKAFEDELWIGDIKPDSILKLCSPKKYEVIFSTNRGNKLTETPEISENLGIQMFKVGFLISYKSNNPYIAILLKRNDKKTVNICCYNKCSVNEQKMELLFDPQEKLLNIVPSFLGKGNTLVQVLNDSGAVCFKEYCENGQLLSVPIENSFIPYFVQFIEKPKGLSLKKERILKEYKETFYGYEDFENKLFEIRLVRYDMFIQNRPIRNQLKLNSMYIHFRRMADMTHYIGRVVSMTAGKLIDFSRLGDVEIEICGDVKNGNMEIALTKDGDGLLLDRPNRKILDDLDDLNAPDIYSYVINLEKREECR